MVPIFAVSLSASQSAGPPEVTATLVYAEDQARSRVSLRWQLPTRINPGSNAGEWLYAVLSRLVQDYDDHTVELVTVTTEPAVEERSNA
jgi:hypothetical protein